MRIEEIEQASAADKREKALKANADRQMKWAKEFKTRTDQTADLLKRRDARRKGQPIQKAMVLPPSVTSARKT